MMIAQRLYEGIDLGDEGTVGLITYMRTDSTRVSNDALREVREWIGKEYGNEFLPESPNTYKSKKDTQDAHEAIRPTSAMRHPDTVKQYLQEDEYKVYKLIWQRFVASQMNPAIFDQTTVDIDATARRREVPLPRDRFGAEVRRLPEGLRRGERQQGRRRRGAQAQAAGAGARPEANAEGPDAEQHFTEPPPRYNEASLVKELEERGIGRPSTYAAIISTIQERQYVQKTGGKFIPTEIGFVVTDLLVANFKDIFDPQYTARLEEELDEIEDGKERWTDALGEFYKKFEKELHYAEKHMENVKRMEKPTDEKCERCGSPLVIKWGKHGSFLRVQRLRQDRSQQLHLHQRESHRPARPGLGRRAGDHAGGVLRELRASHGAEARALRAVHGVYRLSRLQDDAPAGPGEEGSRHSAGRKVPAVRAQTAAAPRPLSASSFPAAAIPSASG